ncbi:hypothetical protein WI372_07535 [Gemmatimonadota bacterium DH-20]|uniref:Uncharacterized protein n=1 Tax=Gaopeijia maritima TaxID=3119007 RepID=A0ABU9E9P8_9BACT
MASLRWLPALLASILIGCDGAPAEPAVDPGPVDDGGVPPGGPNGRWAFEATFDADPAAPSQAVLPRVFDYSVTHRTHPRDHAPVFSSYPADHGTDCAGPSPELSPVPQHVVTTSHRTSGRRPDESFFICRDHLMSSMGDVEGYSVTAFWPRQEFDFADGGVLEFEVNPTAAARSWWEVVILPREQLTVAAARSWLPIDETYPRDRILMDFNGGVRRLEVGTGAIDPDGWIAGASDWGPWATRHPDDPANTDRRIRRTMRLHLGERQLIWAIETASGGLDSLTLDLSEQLPFERGLVLFKTHAYTPRKDGNVDRYTFHWDDIRFTGPVVGRYDAFETEELVVLQANGSRAIGESASATIAVPRTGPDPVIFGQLHNAMRGQVLLSVNGGPERPVAPLAWEEESCHSPGWSSFRVRLQPSELSTGDNELRFTIGPRPDCVADWVWDGFSVKGLEIQLSAVGSGF